MTRLARVSLSFFAALLLATATRAEESPVSKPRENNLPTTPAPKPKRDRAISDGLASALAASMPKYNPPPKPKPEDENVDLRDVDKPRNTIIRLPKYTVQGDRPPVFRERDLYSPSNRTTLAMERYRGLNFGPFASLNRRYALAMYEEQERLDNMSDLNDTADAIGRADPEAGTYIRRATSETFMRSGDFGYKRPE
jgi:hypothetical protein